MQTSVRKINLKLKCATKNKRIREFPESFEALKATVEAFIKDERELLQGEELLIKNGRDYVI